MKLIDFDKLEELTDDEMIEEIEEGWDGDFFKKYAVSRKETEEEEDDIYISLPKELGETKTPLMEEDTSEEEYLRVPINVREEEKRKQKLEKQERRDRQHIRIEHEEDIYALDEKTAQPITIDERRTRLGRALGLRGDGQQEADSKKEHMFDDKLPLKTEPSKEEAVERGGKEQASEETEVEDIPEFDFEAVADEYIAQLQQETSKGAAAMRKEEQPVPEKQDECSNTDGNTEAYVINEMLAVRGIGQNFVQASVEPFVEAEQETSDRDISNSEAAGKWEEATDNADSEVNGEMAESRNKESVEAKLVEQIVQKAGRKEAVEKEQIEETTQETMESASEADEELEEGSSFVDDEELYQIELREKHRLRNEAGDEEIELESLEIDEDDFEEDEEIEEACVNEEAMQEQPNQEEKAQSDEDDVIEDAVDTQEEPVQREETKEELRYSQNADIRKRVKEPVKASVERMKENRTNVPKQPAREMQMEESKQLAGVLEKRKLPERLQQSMPQKVSVKESDIREVMEQAEQAEAVKQKRARSDVRTGKIEKLQSAFEEEFEGSIQDSLFVRRTREQHRDLERRQQKRKKAEQMKKERFDEDDTPDRPFKEFVGLLIGILIVVAVTFLLVEFVGQRTEVSGSSMESTLHDGDNLIVDKISYFFEEPERFDIVVFPYKGINSDEEIYYIKRIIGLPGEKINISNGLIYINGELLEESYGLSGELILNPGRAEKEIQLAEDEYFVLGDNRNNSSDSREIGNIKREDIVGKAWLRIWPLKSFGILKHQ